MCVRLYVIFPSASRTPRARRSGVPFASSVSVRCAALANCFWGAFVPPRSFATSLFVVISLRTEESRKRLRSRMTRRRNRRSELRYCNMRGLLPLLTKFYHDFFLLSRIFPVRPKFRQTTQPRTPKSMHIPQSSRPHRPHASESPKTEGTKIRKRRKIFLHTLDNSLSAQYNNCRSKKSAIGRTPP